MMMKNPLLKISIINFALAVLSFGLELFFTRNQHFWPRGLDRMFVDSYFVLTAFMLFGSSLMCRVSEQELLKASRISALIASVFPLAIGVSFVTNYCDGIWWKYVLAVLVVLIGLLLLLHYFRQEDKRNSQSD